MNNPHTNIFKIYLELKSIKTNNEKKKNNKTRFITQMLTLKRPKHCIGGACITSILKSNNKELFNVYIQDIFYYYFFSGIEIQKSNLNIYLKSWHFWELTSN